jgi:DNA-binding GntR family transcriptional regulator
VGQDATVAEARQSISEVIADELRRRIIEGDLKPGERIREEEIAAPHAVSRVPVREAIRRLEAEGYVALTRFQGASVALPSNTAAIELMQIRRPLEALAARLAAQRTGQPVASQLRRVTKSGLRSVEERNRERHPILVDEFHDLIGVASGNTHLVELLGQLRSKVRWAFAMDLEHRAANAWDEHKAITDAILSGDEDKAAQLMDEHVGLDLTWYLSRHRASED